MNARNLFPITALAFLLVMGCKEQSHVVPSDTETQQVVREVNISIDADQRILLDGEAVALEDLEGKLLEHLGNDSAEFVITVEPQTPMGLINEVQQQLSASRIAGIRYSEPLS